MSALEWLLALGLTVLGGALGYIVNRTILMAKEIFPDEDHRA